MTGKMGYVKKPTGSSEILDLAISWIQYLPKRVWKILIGNFVILVYQDYIFIFTFVMNMDLDVTMHIINNITSLQRVLKMVSDNR